MKKILTLISAVALVSGANAQMQQAREVGTPRSQAAKMEVVSPMLVNPVKGAAKVAEEDTVWCEAAYHTTNNNIGGGYTCTMGSNQSWGDIGRTITHADWLLGTGWANSIYGSGEIGCSFDYSESGWMGSVGMHSDWSKKGVVGALTRICRGRSVGANEEVNNMNMPFYFKLYTALTGTVTEQEAYDDVVSTQRLNETMFVNYPVNPDEYVSVSNTVEVPVYPVAEDPGADHPYMAGRWVGARFETPGIAGDNFCISAMFPANHDEFDTLWNATMLVITDGEKDLHSEAPGVMYVVWDGLNQNMWGTKVSETEFIYARERLSWMLPDTLAQTHATSVITPMTSWHFTNRDGSRTGQRQDFEAIIQVILADGVDIERGAYYDKYVEVKLNPAIDHTVLQSPDMIKNVEIYNLSGKLVKTQACNSQVETISLRGLTSGMYIAKVTTEAGVANKKIMVR